MNHNLIATRLAIQGYVDAQKALGVHPSTAIAIPLSVAEWEALLKSDAPEVDAMQEARRLLARSLAAIRLGEMDFITEICAFLERSEPQNGRPK